MNCRIAAFLGALLFASYASAATYWQYPDTGGLIGTEVLPLSFPQGGGIYQTRKTTVNSISTFVEADLLGKANTWPLGQIWSAQSTFTVAPIFASLTGYCYANGSGSPITCATTIPMSAITGNVPAAKLPAPTASTLGGVQSGTAPAHQMMTGITTAGVPTFQQFDLSDFTGSTTFTSVGGQISAAQIPNSVVTLGMMANIPANSIVGNNTASPATPITLSSSSVLDIFGTTQGSLLYRGASAWTVLGPGSSGQYLTSNGAGQNPTWNSPAGTLGSPYNLLATLTPTSGATTSATSLAAYNEFYITFNNVNTSSSSATLDVLWSINNSTYTSLGLSMGTGSNSTFYGFIDLAGVSAAADVMMVYGYVNATSSPAAAAAFGHPGPVIQYALPGGQVNALRIAVSTGTFSSGTIKIYGR